jgi:hypothetical protein
LRFSRGRNASDAARHEQSGAIGTIPPTASERRAPHQVKQTPEEAFTAINNVRGWWSEEIEGGTEKPAMSLRIVTRTLLIAK